MVEAGRVADFKPNPCEAKNVAREPTLSPIILARVNKCSEYHKKCTSDEEVDRADDPEKDAEGYKKELSHNLNRGWHETENRFCSVCSPHAYRKQTASAMPATTVTA